jgi:NitT/TauT family transport system substrate-binding protein
MEVCMTDHALLVGRRAFLRAAAATGTAALVGLRGRAALAEPPPEITALRLGQFASGCQGPINVASELLQGEGFTDVQYVRLDNNQKNVEALVTQSIHIGVQFSAPLIAEIDRGSDLVTLGGIHAGCFVLFGNGAVRSVRDLKGKAVSVPSTDGLNTAQLYIASMAAFAQPVDEGTRQFADGKVDAIMGFPPLAQELRARKIGRVVVDSTRDRPWSQYFCCMIVAGREFAKKHPVAAKRTVRAIVKATAICAQEPERVARLLVERGVVKQYDYAVQVIKELPYARWRDYDSEDTLRFYALRMHEAGMIKSSPQKIIAQGTDLRFVNELKKELKG